MFNDPQVKTMRRIKSSSLVLCLTIAAGCGGDESSEDSALKKDGSRLAGCFADADCKNNLVCYGANTSAMMATAGFCTDACEPDDPFAANAICPPILNQVATCSPEGECRIDCTGGGDGKGKCPSGMECRDLDSSEMGVAFRCVYTVGTGRGAKKLWEECNPARGSADCAAPDVCAPFGSGQNRRGFCAAPCTMDQECMAMAPAGATARPFCSESLEACSLDCTGGATCPKGMQCIDTSPGDQVTERCRYVPPETPPATMP